jgi:FkbH-like protein
VGHVERRDWFGRPTIREEDRIRSQSLQSGAAINQLSSDPGSQQAFLAGIGANLLFQVSRDGTDARALELVNKTNQFNLNGRRIPEAGWRELLSNHETFLLTAVYSDKFGPLGKIAVVLGRVLGSEAEISAWVMSCRAFSRRIEHATLHYLFERLKVERISFQFEPTSRNTPLRQFFADMKIPESSPILSRADFGARCPQLSHALEEFTASV